MKFWFLFAQLQKNSWNDLHKNPNAFTERNSTFHVETSVLKFLDFIVQWDSKMVYDDDDDDMLLIRKMLSPDSLNSSMQRTTSEPELANGELGYLDGSGRGKNGDIDEVDVANIKQSELSWQAFEQLRKDLERAQKELTKRDTQCQELTKVRDIVDQEIEELTASLFEEANKMVLEANIARASSEKKLHEAELKLDGLQAECHALKALVITSTPANPGGKRGHKKSPSVGQICSNCDTCHFVGECSEVVECIGDPINKKEVDPIVFKSFCTWIEDKCPFKDHAFLSMIHRDDITPCLRFWNDDLSKSLYKAAQSDTLAIEPIKSKPKKCALTGVTGPCPFRIQTGDTDLWYPVSASCRARIVAVIDFLTFLRYIRQGIVKKDVNVLYWDMVKKRASISIARLGLEKPK